MVVASVIGGAGRMGSWLASFLKGNGYHVIISDARKKAAQALAKKKRYQFVADQGEAIRSGELVILATPTQVTGRLLQEVRRKTSPTTLLVEISSMKAPIKRMIDKMQREGAPILSIHPMFGPGAKTLANKTVIVASQPKRNPRAQKFLSIMKRAGARIVQSNLDEHDRLASLLLALPHFVNIAMVNTLRASGVSLETMRKAAGTTFRLQLLTAEAVFHEGLENEVSVLMDSKESLEVLSNFARGSAKTVAIIRKAERGSVIRKLRDDREFLRKDRLFPEAYNRFTAAVEAASLA